MVGAGGVEKEQIDFQSSVGLTTVLGKPSCTGRSAKTKQIQRTSAVTAGRLFFRIVLRRQWQGRFDDALWTTR